MAKFWGGALAGVLSVAAAASALAQEVTIRWGDVVSAQHPSVQMIERVAAAVAEQSGGRIEIQSFPGGQLGGSRDMIEAVANGIQEMVTEGAANFGQWVPAISVVEAPYLWRDPDHMVSALAGPVGEEFNRQLIEQRGMRILGTTYYGTRHLTTSDTEVHSVADTQGLKLRVPENDVFRAMAESWGARPTPMNFNELYLALQQGVVDGQENPLPTIDSAKFQEVQDYLVLTGHIITPRLVVVNEPFWQGLAEDDRALIEQAVADGIAWQNAAIKEAEASLLDGLKQAGMTVIEPDVDSFREATLAKVPPMFAEQWGPDTFEILRRAQ